MFYWDWTFFLLIPGLILSIWAQRKVNSTFKTYSQVMAVSGVSAAEVAEDILRSNGIHDVSVEQIGGQLTDHYDPRDKVLRLSRPVYGSASIAAIGVAAHEAGHAIQHARGWFPIKIRNSIVPVVNISSNLAIPLFFIGLLMGSAGKLLMQIGIIAFAAVVIFHLVTLPVELDASRRALVIIKRAGYLSVGEQQGARRVLSAAAMTYVAGALMALLNLIRMILLSSRD